MIQSSIADARSAPSRERISVLLVDDNPAFLNIEKTFLERYCQNEFVICGTALGFEEALQQARTLEPQLVLLDMVMPGRNGLTMIPYLKQILPQAYIIMLTLWDNEGYREASLLSGADDFVAKGNMKTDLLPAMRRVMHTNPSTVQPELETEGPQQIEEKQSQVTQVANQKHALVFSDSAGIAECVQLAIEHRVQSTFVLLNPAEPILIPSQIDDCALIILVLSSLASQPAITLARAALECYVGQVPFLIISAQPSIFEVAPKVYHMNFPFSTSELESQVRQIVQEEPNSRVGDPSDLKAE